MLLRIRWGSQLRNILRCYLLKCLTEHKVEFGQSVAFNNHIHSAADLLNMYYLHHLRYGRYWEHNVATMYITDVV